MKLAIEPNFRVGLSVDWDFFMDTAPGGIYDCSHYDLNVWSVRPGRYQLAPDYLTFWDILGDHDPQVRLPRQGLVVNRHVEGLTYFLGCDVVLNVDMHTDSETCFKPYLYNSSSWLTGYPGAVIHCNDWTPQAIIDSLACFKDYGHAPIIFDRLLIARSDPWTSPEHDFAFQKFLQACPSELYAIDLADQPRKLSKDGDCLYKWFEANWHEFLVHSKTLTPVWSQRLAQSDANG